MREETVVFGLNRIDLAGVAVVAAVITVLAWFMADGSIVTRTTSAVLAGLLSVAVSVVGVRLLTSR